MARLLLLRHAQIKANRQGRWHGSTDSALTWRGRRQARRTARFLAAQPDPIVAIYSSPLQRCRHTADAVGNLLGLPVAVHDDLREYAIGDWENLPFRQLAEEHRFMELTAGNHDFAPPGGESLRAVADRIVQALREIHDQHDDGQVLLVSHGAALAVALGTLLEDDPASWTNYPLANCSLTQLMLSPAPYVNFFNSTRHL